jgi:hypothetical protein
MPMLRPVRAIMLSAALVLPLGAASVLAQTPAQPDSGKLQPGLAVGYYFAMYHSVDEFKPMKKHGGKPVEQLNYPADGKGNVLTTQSVDGVAADMKGFIKLDRPGTWKFRILSNDGVRVTLGGKQILDDPKVHADHVAESSPIEIKEPGWYDLQVMYFQRKGTWALTLYWQPPGGEDDVVPAEAFAHIKD